MIQSNRNEIITGESKRVRERENAQHRKLMKTKSRCKYAAKKSDLSLFRSFYFVVVADGAKPNKVIVRQMLGFCHIKHLCIVVVGERIRALHFST